MYDPSNYLLNEGYNIVVLLEELKRVYFPPFLSKCTIENFTDFILDVVHSKAHMVYPPVDHDLIRFIDLYDNDIHSALDDVYRHLGLSIPMHQWIRYTYSVS